MWHFYLLQTADPLFDSATEISIDSFQWTLALGSDSLTTVSSFNAGADEAGTVELPWSAVDADDKFTAARMIQTGKYSILLCWVGDGATYPVLWGAIAERTDTWFGTSFALDTIWDLLDARLPYNLNLNSATKAPDTPDVEDLSRRGLAATVGEFIDEGGLPEIDWQYAGEEGDYSYDLNTTDELMSYTMTGYINYILNDVYLGSRLDKYDVSPEYESAPCASFRPEFYYNNKKCWRLVFVADSDEDEEPEVVRTFTVDEISDWQCQHLQPYEQVQMLVSFDDYDYYGAAGDETYTDLGYPLRQYKTTVSKDEFSANWMAPQEYINYVLNRSNVELEYQNQPLAQMSFSVPCDGVVGQLWPGDKIALDIEEEDDFPVLPATYEGRIIEMQGNQGGLVTITMEPLQDPLYYPQYQLD